MNGRLTKREIRLLSDLRGRPIDVCPRCGREVEAPRTAKDVRKLSSVDGKLAHKACSSSLGSIEVEKP